MANVKGGAVKDQLALDVSLDRLRKLRDKGLQVTKEAMQIAARRGGCSLRTAYRRRAGEVPKGRQLKALTPQEQAYVHHSRVAPEGGESTKHKREKGNLHAAWKMLQDDHLFPHHYRTFVRRFHNLDEALQHGLLEGRDAMLAYLPFLELAKPSHFLEVVEADHCELTNVTLYDPVTKRTNHPWITLIVDVWSRMILGFAVTLGTAGGTATSESVFLALADALLTYGKFEWFRYDQGADFMGPVAEALERLEVHTAPCPAYSPWTKPTVERFVRTLKHSLLPALVAAGHGITEEEAA